MRDPLGSIRATYDRLGRSLSAEAEQRMRAYLDAKPRGTHGQHVYSLDEFGIDRARIRKATADYMARYEISVED
jgi:hypothetical protein